ncbi:MAG: hypothetical protein ONB44_24100 [candidate division KSB1 bacterium]|nr:hypothetical protein [candidate division KSB1 bacterium]MDZ7305225.1 hypothetical protein [candidate division KSB1 bacterium]MDZ7314336.1 hypothetical protein [candidate division KSB1 bacterium]
MQTSSRCRINNGKTINPDNSEIAFWARARVPPIYALGELMGLTPQRFMAIQEVFMPAKDQTK